MVVLGNNLARLGNGRLRVIGKPGVDFGGNAPRHDGQNLFAEGNRQALESQVGNVFVCRTFAQFVAGILQHAVHNRLILRQLRGCGNERGVGRGILGAKLLHRLDIACIGNHHGVLAQLFKQILRHDFLLGKALGAAARSLPVYPSFDASAPFGVSPFKHQFSKQCLIN